MSEGIKSFSWTENISKIKTGWSEGPYFKTPNLSPSMTIVSGVPAEVDAKLKSMTPSEGKIIDSWNQRRGN